MITSGVIAPTNMERELNPPDDTPERTYRQVYVTIELSVMSDDDADACSLGWNEVEAIAKKNHWNVLNADTEQP